MVRGGIGRGTLVEEGASMASSVDIRASNGSAGNGGRLFDLLDVDAGRVIQTLITDPGIGVGVISDAGMCLYLNDQAARIFHGPDAKAADHIGSHWKHTMPKEWGDERLAILKHIRETGKPVLMRTMWNGRQHVTWISPIDVPEEDDEPARFLTITRRIDADQLDEELHNDGFEFVESGVADFGALDVLSVRELEVLALIGQGLTTREIASMLFRSEKTIDGHRQSIGKKLGAASKTDLARIAQHAGLLLQDAGKKRL